MGITATGKDAFNNVATGYTGIVQITSSDIQAGLPANYKFTSGDAGVNEGVVGRNVHSYEVR